MGRSFPNQKRKICLKGTVLRYVAELGGNVMDEKGGILTVQLQAVPKDSVLGQLKGSDSLFEIYTESYGDHPIVEGAELIKATARGFGDILRF
ncbi:MAG: hypothetical protein R2793_01355 [Flavobacteriaceae bacterium]